MVVYIYIQARVKGKTNLKYVLGMIVLLGHQEPREQFQRRFYKYLDLSWSNEHLSTRGNSLSRSFDDGG